MPDNVRTFTPPPVRVESQKLADGVYYLTGGSHHSLAIEMRDHIVVVDMPNDEARATRRARESEGADSEQADSVSW